MASKDLGYPFGRVIYPDGWELKVIPASCGSDDHFSHPFCSPGWEEDVVARGGKVLANPVLDVFEGWIVPVAFPPKE